MLLYGLVEYVRTLLRVAAFMKYFGKISDYKIILLSFSKTF